MSIVVPVISKNQGGQGAVTFNSLKQDAIISAQQGAPLVQAALTPAFPSIVQPPVFALPVKLTPGLPSMTPGQVTPGTGGVCARNEAYEEARRGNWMCRLGAWVDENGWMAAGVVALAYMVAHGKSKR
jgi:hypothetical protein